MALAQADLAINVDCSMELLKYSFNPTARHHHGAIEQWLEYSI